MNIRCKTCLIINNQNHEMKICRNRKKKEACVKRQKMLFIASKKVGGDTMKEE